MQTETLKHTFNISKVAEELVPNKINRNAYLLSGLIAILLLGVAMLLYAKLPDRLPILLTAPWGEARLAPKIAIFGGSALIIVVIGVNITLGKLWGGGGSLIPRMLSIAASIFAISIAIAFWGMIQSFFL